MKDNDIIELLRQRNKEAFRLIFERYYDKLTYIARFFIKNDEALREDIVQDVLCGLIQKKSWDDVEDLKRYLHTCIKNRCFHELRNQKNTTARNIVIGRDIYINKKTSPGEFSEKYNTEGILSEMKSHLSAQRRLAIKLVYEQELTYKQAAHIMGISLNTLKKHIQHALESLRNQDYFMFLLERSRKS